MIQVEEKREESIDSFDDVRDEIEENVRKEKAREAIRELAKSVESLDGLSGQYEIKNTGWIARGDIIDGISPKDKDMVFYTAGRITQGQKPEPVFGAETCYLIEVTDVKKPQPKTFEEAGTQVLADARDAAAKRQAMAAAQSDLDRILAGDTTWEQVVKERKVTPVETHLFSQSGGYVEGFMMNSRDFVAAAFRMEKLMMSVAR